MDSIKHLKMMIFWMYFPTMHHGAVALRLPLFFSPDAFCFGRTAKSAEAAAEATTEPQPREDAVVARVSAVLRRWSWKSPSSNFSQ